LRHRRDDQDRGLGSSGGLLSLGRRSNSFADHLVTVGILAQHRKLAVSKDAVQVQGLPGLVCPVELIPELLQRHPLNRLHGTTVTMFRRDDSSAGT
jgi:hypothetical protein